MAKIGIGVYVAAVIALIMAALHLWQLRCEGFGCMGIGIAWLAWAAAFGVSALVGLGVWAACPPNPAWRHLLTGATWLQALVGVTLFAWWLRTQLAFTS